MGDSIHIQGKSIKKATFCYYTLHNAFHLFWHFDYSFVYEQQDMLSPI